MCIWEIRIFSFPPVITILWSHLRKWTAVILQHYLVSIWYCFSFSHRCLCTLGLCDLGSEQGSHLGDSRLSLWIYSNFASSFFPLPFICGKLRSFVPSRCSGFAWLYPSNVLLHSLYFFGRCSLWVVLCIMSAGSKGWFSPGKIDHGFRGLLAWSLHFKFLISLSQNGFSSCWWSLPQSIYYFMACVRAQSWSHVWLFVTPWTIAHQALLSVGSSRQDYWSGLPCPPPGALPDPGIEPTSPALAGRFFTTVPPGKPRSWVVFSVCAQKAEPRYSVQYWLLTALLSWVGLICWQNHTVRGCLYQCFSNCTCSWLGISR